MNVGNTENKPWHVKITKDNYELLNKWWSKSTMYFLNQNGICGMYLNTSNKLVIGQTEGVIKKNHFDFGEFLTLEEFQHYILKTEIQHYILKTEIIHECW